MLPGTGRGRGGFADLSSQPLPTELGEPHKGRTTVGPEGGIDLEGLGGGGEVGP